jgi:hypothetical protein
LEQLLGDPMFAMLRQGASLLTSPFRPLVVLGQAQDSLDPALDAFINRIQVASDCLASLWGSPTSGFEAPWMPDSAPRWGSGRATSNPGGFAWGPLAQRPQPEGSGGNG